MSYFFNAIYVFLTAPSSRQDSYKSLPFHGVVWPVLVIDIAYLLFVYKIGPWFMKNRQPYQLKGIIRYYNIGQIIYNGLMSVMAIYLFAIKRPVPISCITSLPYDHSLKQLECILTYLYSLNKFIDYLDTVFFVLRKSYKQVTFLHVYHHIMMTSASIICLKYYGTGGHVSIIGMLNSMVHVFMYTYYLISATNPGIKKSLWWKKYITRLQIIQFVAILIHQSGPLIFQPDCKVSKVLCTWGVLQAIVMIYMFSNFYINAYIKTSKKEPSQKAK